MIRILKFLITGDWHLHHWVDKTVFDRKIDNINKKYTSKLFVKECSVCGKLKGFDSRNMDT